MSNSTLVTKERAFSAPLTIGVLSDTHIYHHGQLTLPKEIPILFRRFGCGLILHGGDCNIIEPLRALAEVAPLIVVAGNNDRDEDLLEIAPDEVLFTVGAKKVALFHGTSKRSAVNEAKTRFAGKADLIVFGHSHMPLIEQAKGSILFNPGSPTERRWAAHFGIGIVTITDSKIDPELILFNHPRDLATINPR